MNWNPKAEPWRVAITRRCPGLPGGWATGVRTFSDADEAREEFEKAAALRVYLLVTLEYADLTDRKPGFKWRTVQRWARARVAR